MEHKVTILEDDNVDLEDDIPDEIDFSKARLIRRGFHPFAHMVRLDDDIAAYFSTPEAVNDALRRVMNEQRQAPL